MIRRVALLAAALALPAVASAQALDRCVPQEEAAALVTFALPTMVEQLAKRCGPELPPQAYLPRYAHDLADRYRPDAAAAWPIARRAIGDLFQRFLGQPMPSDMNSDMVRVLTEPALAGLLASRIKTSDCAIADRAIANLGAVSGREVGNLVALGAAIADRKGQGIAGVLRVCRPEDTRRP